MATIAVSTSVPAGAGARTDWFKDAGYGLFCHWGSRSVNADGSKKDYYTAVKEFDVNAFANQVEETGARFVIFTIIHERHELAFPSAVMDSLCPGHTTTQRDLYADMYTALHAKGIRMMFYWNMHATKEEPDWHDGSKWATDPAWFVQKHYALAEEIGKRYGDRLAGWWLDHCYDNDPRLPENVRNWGAKYDFAKYAAKLRSGNTNRIVAFNFRWKFWGCDWGKGIMDYQAGEDGLENNWLPASRFSGEGGTQWFACDATDDPNWVHVSPGIIKPRYDTERVIAYIKNVISNQGVYAYNCALYNSGKIAEATMEQLRAVRNAIRGEDLNPRPMIGAYYFDGWAGRSKFADDPKQSWARQAPTHLTQRMIEEFPEREPVWGWRDDALEIMERQIDLAADHGLAFFAFCWYWHANGQALNEKEIRADPKHISLDLFLKAKNNQRMKFCLLVANHQGYEIKGAANWKRAGEFWLPYFEHQQHLTVGGKPLVIVFDANGGDRDGFAAMQETARQTGLPGLAIAGCAGGAVENGYTHRTHYNVVPGYDVGSAKHTYAELAAANRAQWNGAAAQPYIPIVTAGWDKRPWEGPTGLNQKAGWYYPDRTPEQFADFLRKARDWMAWNPGQTTAERLVMIYAWNEFGEGGHIAPTKGDPDGKYLEAVRSVALPATARQPGPEARTTAPRKILFLGNSITRHPPKPDIGWTNYCGMAASAQEKDYVHLLLKRFAAAAGGKAPEARIENIADFEREYATYAIATKVRALADFKADTVILAIGENVPALATQQDQDRFREALRALLALVQGSGKPALYVRSCFWPDAVKDAILKQVGTEAGGTFVDISRLASDEKNYARAERKFSHDGVAAHPGDAGMAAIAEAIWKAMPGKR